MCSCTSAVSVQCQRSASAVPVCCGGAHGGDGRRYVGLRPELALSGLGMWLERRRSRLSLSASLCSCRLLPQPGDAHEGVAELTAYLSDLLATPLDCPQKKQSVGRSRLELAAKSHHCVDIHAGLLTDTCQHVFGGPSVVVVFVWKGAQTSPVVDAAAYSEGGARWVMPPLTLRGPPPAHNARSTCVG